MGFHHLSFSQISHLCGSDNDLEQSVLIYNEQRFELNT